MTLRAHPLTRRRASSVPRTVAWAAIVTTTLGVLACGTTPPTEESPATAATPRTVDVTTAGRESAGIMVEAVRTVARRAVLTAPGLVAVDDTRTARIGSLQEALVLDTPVNVGDRVRAQQVLASMHGHAMHDAWAGYRKAIAERRRADSQLAYATEVHDRARRLLADKAVSLQEVQRAELDRVSAVQSVEMAKAEILRSIEELEHVGVIAPDPNAPIPAEGQTTEQIPVRSPIAGVVLERLVTPGTTVTPGTPLFVVSDLTSLWVVAEVDEARIAQVRLGAPVEVEVAGYPGERFTGRITFVADRVSPDTRRLLVRSTVPNPNGRLKPEMFATVSLGAADATPTIVVRSSAVQTIDGTSTVFVETATNRFAPRAVQLGQTIGSDVEVLSGLTLQDRVVVNGAFALKSDLLQAAAPEEP